MSKNMFGVALDIFGWSIGWTIGGAIGFILGGVIGYLIARYLINDACFMIALIAILAPLLGFIGRNVQKQIARND